MVHRAKGKVRPVTSLVLPILLLCWPQAEDAYAQGGSYINWGKELFIRQSSFATQLQLAQAVVAPQKWALSVQLTDLPLSQVF